MDHITVEGVSFLGIGVCMKQGMGLVADFGPWDDISSGSKPEEKGGRGNQ